MPLTDRVNFVGTNLRVTNCDDTFEDKPIPCGCQQNPEEEGGDYPPIPGQTLCEKAGIYTRITMHILALLKFHIVENYSDTLPGWTSAASKTAYDYKMPAYFAIQVPIKMIDQTIHDSFMNLNLSLDGSPQSAAIWQAVGCVFFQSFTAQFGNVVYTDLKTRFAAAGLVGYGEIMTCIPLAFLNEQSYMLSVNSLPDTTYPTVLPLDCEDCEEAPPPTPDTCEECTSFTCYALKAGENNAFPVSPSNLLDFAANTAAAWYPDNFEHLVVDLGEERCISRVATRMYTHCPATGSDRSVNVRVQIDGIDVTEFRCAPTNTIQFTACSAVDAATVNFIFTTPIQGRYIHLIGERPRQTIVQINVTICE